MVHRKKLKNNKLFFEKIAVFLFLFFLPTQLGKHFFLEFSYINGVRVDYLSLILYFTDLLFLILFFLNRNLIFAHLRKNVKLLTLFVFLLISNFLISKFPLLSFYRVLKILEFYFLFIIFKNFKDQKLVLISFLFAGLFQLILALAQLYQKSSLQGIFYFFGERYLSLLSSEVAKASIEGIEFLRPYGTFSHPNSLAGFFLLLYFFFLTNKSFNRFLLGKQFSLLIFSLLIFVSFSKVAIITYLGLNFFYLLVFERKKFSCLICQLAKITVILVVGFVFLTAKTDPLSWKKRINLLKDGFSILLTHPFGVGFNHYLVYQAKFPQKYPYFFLQPVHNIFLLFLTEAGVILTVFFGYIFWQFIKNRLKNLMFVFCLLVVLFTGFFDHYWLTLQQNWLLLSVVFGLIF